MSKSEIPLSRIVSRIMWSLISRKGTCVSFSRTQAVCDLKDLSHIRHICISSVFKTPVAMGVRAKRCVDSVSSSIGLVEISASNFNRLSSNSLLVHWKSSDGAHSSLIPEPSLNKRHIRVNTFRSSIETPKSMWGLSSLGP